MNTLFSSAAVLFRNSKRSLLYGSMAALTVGLEELIESVVFNCPCEGHFAYGLAFLWAPAFILFLAGILIDKDLWKLARKKKKTKSQTSARRYLKVLMTAPYIFINAGIAPTAWLVLSFLQQQYYTCAYFGPPLHSNATVVNASDRCHRKLGFRARELEESYKTRSQIAGWSMMLMAVCVLFTSICIRRCIQKDKELTMPRLDYYRHKEAEAALHHYHVTVKEMAKQNGKENVEASFLNAKGKPFDECIQAVAQDINQRYARYLVIPSPQSPQTQAQENVVKLLQFPEEWCGFEMADGPQANKSNNNGKTCNSEEVANSTACNNRNPKPVLSRVRLDRQKPVIDSV